MNVTKNYNEPGGAKLVIGGELAIAADAVVKVGGSVVEFTGSVINAYTKTEADLLLVDKLTADAAANQVASVAATIADLKTDVNALLTKLKAAGIMDADA